MADVLDRILALVRSERPNLRLVDKHESAVLRTVGRAVPFLLGGSTTVVGDTVWLPGPPDRIPRRTLARILAHELVHQLDQARWGPAFYLTYALTPLPVGRTTRAHWERRAYAVDLLLAHQERGDRGLRAELDRLATLFAGPHYAWMYAGEAAARAYLSPLADAVRSGALAKEDPYDRILAAWNG